MLNDCDSHVPCNNVPESLSFSRLDPALIIQFFYVVVLSSLLWLIRYVSLAGPQLKLSCRPAKCLGAILLP